MDSTLLLKNLIKNIKYLFQRDITKYRNFFKFTILKEVVSFFKEVVRLKVTGCSSVT